MSSRGCQGPVPLRPLSTAAETIWTAILTGTKITSQPHSLTLHHFSLISTLGDQTPHSLEPPRSEPDSSQLFRELIFKKKQLLFGRLSSFDSDSEEVASGDEFIALIGFNLIKINLFSVAASDTGSMTTNPAFQRGGRVFSSIRSAMSDNEMDDSVSRHLF